MVNCYFGDWNKYLLWDSNITQKIRLKKLDAVALGMPLYLLLFGITLWQSPLLHYDNFTHWATIVKFLHLNNTLPEQTDAIIGYYDYPVGSSLFLYYFTTLVGFSDGSMLLGQFILILSALYGIFASLRDSRRMLMVLLLFSTLAIFNYLNIAIRLNNLWVDFLIPALMLAVVGGFIAHKDEFLPLSLNTAVILGVLSIVKTSGLFFVVIGMVIYTVLAFRLLRRRRLVWSQTYLISVTILMSFISNVLWRWHVSEHFENASKAKHAISSSELLGIFSGHMTTVARDITMNFVKVTFSLNSLALHGIMFINIVCLIAVIVIGFFLKRPKRVLFSWLLSNLILITYYVGIWLMYLVAMPKNEALELAGFERYASSIVIFVLGFVMMILVREMDYCLVEQNIQRRNIRSFKSLTTKRLYQNSSLILLFFTIGMLLSENNGIQFNNRKSSHNVSQKIKKIVGDRQRESVKKVLVVSADRTNVENYFIQYATRYYLWDVHVDARENFMLSTSQFKKLLKNYDQVLILDSHYTFGAMSKKTFGKTYSTGLHSTQEMLSLSR